MTRLGWFLAVGLLVAGCGGSDGDSAEPETTDDALASVVADAMTDGVACPKPGEEVTQELVDAGACQLEDGGVGIVFWVENDDCTVASWGAGWGIVGQPAKDGEATSDQMGMCP